MALRGFEQGQDVVSKVVAGQADGGAAPHRPGHAEIGPLGEQEFHNSAAAQPGTVASACSSMGVTPMPLS
jgi:hypothetical protein